LSLYLPAEARRIDPLLLRELHGLTVAESDVAALLFNGQSAQAAARYLGISVNTVKSHLKQVFKKCGVRTQAELLQGLALGPRHSDLKRYEFPHATEP
jgi:DNA-binding CsgD family transcriptional regulator